MITCHPWAARVCQVACYNYYSKFYIPLQNQLLGIVSLGAKT
jgi:hypothetical protein